MLCLYLNGVIGRSSPSIECVSINFSQYNEGIFRYEKTPFSRYIMFIFILKTLVYTIIHGVV